MTLFRVVSKFASTNIFRSQYFESSGRDMKTPSMIRIESFWACSVGDSIFLSVRKSKTAVLYWRLPFGPSGSRRFWMIAS